MSFELLAYANRTTDFTVALFETDGTTPLVLGASDAVRCKIGRRGAVVLDLRSGTPTANKSLVSIEHTDPASATLRLAQADTAALAGTYDAEVLVVDAAETQPANAVKAAQYGVLHVYPSQDGGVA